MKNKKCFIVGASGFGREVLWLINRINKVSNSDCIETFFIVDGIDKGTLINNCKVAGDINYLANNIDEYVDVYIAIGNSKNRKLIVDKLKKNKYLCFPNLVDPSVMIDDTTSHLGVGNIICASSVITCNVKLGDFVIVNLDCTVGHDAIINDFVTLYPSVNVSGNVIVGTCSEIGTGTQVIQKLEIGSQTIIGAGSVVVKDIVSNCTAVGVPAKVIKEI